MVTISDLFGFNADSSPIENEPLIIRVDNNGGQKTYYIHEVTNPGDRMGDNVVSYGEEAFRKKYGDTNLRRLEEYKEEYSSIPETRRNLLESAIKAYNDSSDSGRIPEVLESFAFGENGYFAYTESNLKSALMENTLPDDIHNKINAALSESENLNDKYLLMGSRITEIEKDMNERGVHPREPYPEESCP